MCYEKLAYFKAIINQKVYTLLEMMDEQLWSFKNIYEKNVLNGVGAVGVHKIPNHKNTISKNG